VFFADSSLDDRGPARFRTLALESFREAALADPGNEAAKRNVELVQTLFARRTREQAGGSDALGESGAGANPAGEGF
jgi:hypothetical protein